MDTSTTGENEILRCTRILSSSKALPKLFTERRNKRRSIRDERESTTLPDILPFSRSTSWCYGKNTSFREAEDLDNPVETRLRLPYRESEVAIEIDDVR